MYRHLCLLLNDVLFFLSLFKKNYNNNTCILKRGAQTQRTGVKYVVVDMMYETVFTTTTTTSTTVYNNIIPIKTNQESPFW